MSIDRHLDQWKQRFNDSCFFSTQVSSSSRLHKEDSRTGKNLYRISSKFTDEPVTYFRKVKERRREIQSQHLAAVRNNIRLKNSLDKAEKQANICRHEFIKLYHNKKFRLSEESSMSDHKTEAERYFRLSVQKFKRQRWEGQISVSLRKQDHMKRVEDLQLHRKIEEKHFRQTFRANEEKIRRNVLQSHEKVRKERLQFQQRRKNLQELASTKSKFNYMTKINEEMLRIKECQDKLRELDQEQNPESQSQSRSLPNIFATTFTSRFN